MNMQELADWLAKNPWLTLVGFAIGLIGFILGIVFYFKSKKDKIPRYSLWSINIVRDLEAKIKGLKVAYEEVEVANLTLSKVAFWNAGRETIHKQDIAAAEPLAIKLKNESRILDVKILFQKTPANNFSITTNEDKKQVLLSFDYIDKDEGTVIQFLHTGKSSEDIEVVGKIKGASAPAHERDPLVKDLNPMSVLDRKKESSLGFFDNIFVFIFMLVIFLGPVVGAVWLILTPETQWLPLIIRITVAVVGLVLVYRAEYKSFSGGVPEGFSSFRERL
jgi:hypothetical protein